MNKQFLYMILNVPWHIITKHSVDCKYIYFPISMMIAFYSDLPFSPFSPFSPWFPLMPCWPCLPGKPMMPCFPFLPLAPCTPRLPREPLLPLWPGGPGTHTFSNGWHSDAGLSLLNCLVISLRTSSTLRDLLLTEIKLRRTLVFVVFSVSKKKKTGNLHRHSFTLDCGHTSTYIYLIPFKVIADVCTHAGLTGFISDIRYENRDVMSTISLLTKKQSCKTYVFSAFFHFHSNLPSKQIL